MVKLHDLASKAFSSLHVIMRIINMKNHRNIDCHKPLVLFIRFISGSFSLMRLHKNQIKTKRNKEDEIKFDIEIGI